MTNATQVNIQDVLAQLAALQEQVLALVPAQETKAAPKRHKNTSPQRCKCLRANGKAGKYLASKDGYCRRCRPNSVNVPPTPARKDEKSVNVPEQKAVTKAKKVKTAKVEKVKITADNFMKHILSSDVGTKINVGRLKSGEMTPYNTVVYQCGRMIAKNTKARTYVYSITVPRDKADKHGRMSKTLANGYVWDRKTGMITLVKSPKKYARKDGGFDMLVK